MHFKGFVVNVQESQVNLSLKPTLLPKQEEEAPSRYPLGPTLLPPLQRSLNVMCEKLTALLHYSFPIAPPGACGPLLLPAWNYRGVAWAVVPLSTEMMSSRE